MCLQLNLYSVAADFAHQLHGYHSDCFVLVACPSLVVSWLPQQPGVLLIGYDRRCGIRQQL